MADKGKEKEKFKFGGKASEKRKRELEERRALIEEKRRKKEGWEICQRFFSLPRICLLESSGYRGMGALSAVAGRSWGFGELVEENRWRRTVTLEGEDLVFSEEGKQVMKLPKRGNQRDQIARV